VTAELATVTVVDLVLAEVGSKESWPVVQVPAAARIAFAVQVPKACVNSASELENGVVPKVTDPPCAVIVTVPQVPVVLTPCVAEQESEVGLTVRNAVAVPESAKVVPVPAEVPTVTVSDLAPEVGGLKVMVPVVQELPETMVELAVQVPKPTVKSVESEFENGEALKVTGPPEALKVMEPVQVELEPAFTVAQAMLPLAARAPSVPVPDKLKDVPPPLVGFTETVSESAPTEAGLKVTVAVQVCPTVKVTPAQPLTVKSVESVLEKGVAPKVTLPEFAVMVSEPAPHAPLVPAPRLPQARLETLAVAKLLPVPDRVKVVPVPCPVALLIVTVADRAPLAVGVKLMTPVVQEPPGNTLVPLVHVPFATVKSEGFVPPIVN
jgi:hypothetical protein